MEIIVKNEEGVEVSYKFNLSPKLIHYFIRVLQNIEKRDKDYSGEVLQFDNYRKVSLASGESILRTLKIRLADKLGRLRVLIDKYERDKWPVFAKLLDAFEDITGYGLTGVYFLEEDKDLEDSNKEA